MKIIVCGGGQVGFSLVRYLSAHDNDVTVIDQSDAVVNYISRTLDVRAMQGFASHPDVLARAELEEADMMIAVTRSDEVNMVACQIAHSLFNVPLKIAHIRNKNYLNPEWSSLYHSENIPIDLVLSPELEVARAISRGLEIPGAFEVIPFADKTLQLVGIRCKGKIPLLNTPLRLLGSLFPQLALSVLFIVRGERGFVPTGDDQLQDDDEVYLLIPQEKLQYALEAFGFIGKPAQRLLILGGGNVGLYLTEEVEANHPSMSLMLVEKDKERAAYVANLLSRTIVLQGDALDQEILQEANAAMADKVVAVTADDKTNILASLMAKRLGTTQAMALINSTSYSPMLNSLGIDSVISPQSLTASSILQYIHRGHIRTLHSLRDNFGEVIEAEALTTSNVLGKTVGDINVPGKLMIGAIVRDDQVFIPREGTLIKVHDRIVLIVTNEALKKFEKLFAVRLEYF